jgi:hypothetical protein
MSKYYRSNNEIYALLQTVQAQGVTIMAAIDDFNVALGKLATSITNLQGSVATENAAITAALAVITNPSSTDAQIEAATAAVAAASAIIDTLTSGAAQEAAAITAALPPVPTP